MKLSVMDNNNNGSFWPSYVDVMTTLFAIMLVLFAVSFSRFKAKEREYQQTVDTLQKTQKQLNEIVDEYDDILKIYSTVGKIDATDYFGYNKPYLKHLCQINVEYQTKEYAINKLKLDLTDVNAADNKRDSIVAAGELIKNTILELNSSLPDTIEKVMLICLALETGPKVSKHLIEKSVGGISDVGNKKIAYETLLEHTYLPLDEWNRILENNFDLPPIMFK